jgi:hypothetical protein
MNVFFHEYLHDFMICYIDGIFIFSNQLVGIFGYIISGHDIFMHHHEVQSVDWATLAFVCDLQHFLDFPIFIDISLHIISC